MTPMLFMPLNKTDLQLKESNYDNKFVDKMKSWLIDIKQATYILTISLV